MIQFMVRLHMHVPHVLEMCPESHSNSEERQTLPLEPPALTPALTLTLGARGSQMSQCS